MSGGIISKTKAHIFRQLVDMTFIVFFCFIQLPVYLHAQECQPSFAEDITVSDAEIKELSGGGIVVRERKSCSSVGMTYEAIGYLKGTLDDYQRVLAKYEDYPLFMPSIKNLDVKEKYEDGSLNDYTIELPLGMQKRYRLKTKISKTPQRLELRWKLQPRPDLKPGDTIKDSSGNWVIENLAEQNGYVRVLYHLYTDPGFVPPGTGWIVRTLTKNDLPCLLRATEKRVQMLYPRVESKSNDFVISTLK